MLYILLKLSERIAHYHIHFINPVDKDISIHVKKQIQKVIHVDIAFELCPSLFKLLILTALIERKVCNTVKSTAFSYSKEKPKLLAYYDILFLQVQRFNILINFQITSIFPRNLHT